MGPALSLLCGVLREDRSLVLALALLLCLVAQSCRALCDPGTVAHQDPLSMGFSQARILEWAVTSSSRGSSRPRDRTHVSYASCIGRWVF